MDLELVIEIFSERLKNASSTLETVLLSVGVVAVFMGGVFVRFLSRRFVCPYCNRRGRHKSIHTNTSGQHCRCNQCGGVWRINLP
jgi:hypothetical protein